MGGLFGGGGTTISTSDPLIGAIRIQTSAYGQPVPIVLGKTRVTANLIWYGDFQAIPHTTTTSSGGGGKGGGGEVTSSNTTYTYQAAVAMNLCEGPVSSIGSVWASKDQTNMGALGLTLYSGSPSQAPWGYLSTKHPDQALAYPGSAYVAGAAYQLNSSAGLPNHSFEVAGPLAFSGSIPDANPRDIVAEFLTNPRWGAGFPSALIGDLTQFSAYCVANGIFLSPAIVEQRQAQEYLAEWVRLCNSQIVWSEGRLKIVPYGDQPATGNGVSFTPAVTPIYDLSDDDFLPGSGDPITVTRKTVADAFNAVQVEFINRGNQYNVEIAEAKDQSDIELRGLRPAEPLQAHAIANPAVARFVAQKEVQRHQQVRNSYEFRLGWKYCLLEPMDIVTLTDAGLGLEKFPVRITEIEEDEDGALTVRAEEFPSGVATASLYPVQIVGGYVLNNNVQPGPVNDPVIFEPPNVMTAPNLEVWIAASGGADWGGCEVWVSEDNASYRRAGVISNPARHGVLSAQLATGSDPDTTHTLAVDLSVSRGQLVSGTQADADNGNTLLWVDGELIAYQTAALTAQYRYTLSYLRRGQKGSNIGAHVAGAKFARLDGAIFRYVVPREAIGRPLWLKFASFNVFGSARQSLAECAAYRYTIRGNRPAGLASLSANGGMFLNQLAWVFAAAQYDRDYTEIWGSTSNDRATALPITSAKSPTAAWKHPGLQPGQTWYYWGRVVDTSGNTSDFWPASATGGIAAAPSSDPSALLTQLQGALGMPQLAADLATPIAQIETIAGSIADAEIQEDILRAGLQVLDAAERIRAKASIETEQTIRQEQDLALAQQITTAVAAVNATTAAAVQVEATARAAALGEVTAKWGVKVQTMADGKRALAGVELLAGTDGESVFAVLADKLLVYKPDGSGTPTQIITLGMINGQTALGLNGNLIADGSVTARMIAADALVVADGSITTAKIGDAAIISAKIGTAAVDDLHIKDGAVTLSAFASDNGFSRYWTAGSFSAGSATDTFSALSFATKSTDEVTITAFCYLSTTSAGNVLDLASLTPFIELDGVAVVTGKTALWRRYEDTGHIALHMICKAAGNGATRTARLKISVSWPAMTATYSQYRISNCILSAFIRRR